MLFCILDWKNCKTCWFKSACVNLALYDPVSLGERWKCYHSKLRLILFLHHYNSSFTIIHALNSINISCLRTSYYTIQLPLHSQILVTSLPHIQQSFFISLISPPQHTNCPLPSPHACTFCSAPTVCYLLSTSLLNYSYTLWGDNSLGSTRFLYHGMKEAVVHFLMSTIVERQQKNVIMLSKCNIVLKLFRLK